MPTNKPAKTDYQKLVDDIASIYDQAMSQMKVTFDHILTDAYVEIGRRLIQEEQKGKLRAEYGTRLLEKIAVEMSKTNRRGFSAENLRRMRRVAIAFPIRSNSTELTWSHYVELASIKDKKQRQSYLRVSIQKKWNIAKLKESLSKDQVQREVEEAKTLPAPKNPQIIRLAVKRGVLQTYRVVEPAKVFKEDISGTFLIDCGFYNYRYLPVRGKYHPKPDDVIKIFQKPNALPTDPYLYAKLDPKDFAPSTLLYTYDATVERITDADTITVVAKLGFDMFSRQKLRLRSINAPEIETKRGQEAREFVNKRIPKGSRLVVKTYSTDIFDRYLVDIFFLTDCADPEKIAAEGSLLNQELLDEDMADIWRVPDPTELAFLN